MGGDFLVLGGLGFRGLGVRKFGVLRILFAMGAASRMKKQPAEENTSLVVNDFFETEEQH